jgi:hypothetical protein
VTILCSKSTCPEIPWTSIGPRPLQDVEVTILCSKSTCPEIPWTSIGPQPLKYWKTPVLRSRCTPFRFVDSRHAHGPLDTFQTGRSIRVPTRTIAGARLVGVAYAYVAKACACERERELVVLVYSGHDEREGIRVERKQEHVKKRVRGQKKSGMEISSQRRRSS